MVIFFLPCSHLFSVCERRGPCPPSVFLLMYFPCPHPIRDICPTLLHSSAWFVTWISTKLSRPPLLLPFPPKSQFPTTLSWFRSVPLPPSFHQQFHLLHFYHWSNLWQLLILNVRRSVSVLLFFFTEKSLQVLINAVKNFKLSLEKVVDRKSTIWIKAEVFDFFFLFLFYLFFSF